jgi:hypothetical protein
MIRPWYRVVLLTWVWAVLLGHATSSTVFTEVLELSFM